MLKYFSLTKCQLLESYIQAFQFTPPRFCNSLFEKEKPIHKFKQKSNQKIFHHNYTWNYKHTSIIHKSHKKKLQKDTFTSFIIYLIPATKVLKSLHLLSPLRTPKSAFPKTQVHLSSNVLAFSSKRKRVFHKTLWGFPLNSSAFSPEISLFTQIFSCLIT